MKKLTLALLIAIWLAPVSFVSTANAQGGFEPPDSDGPGEFDPGDDEDDSDDEFDDDDGDEGDSYCYDSFSLDQGGESISYTIGADDENLSSEYAFVNEDGEEQGGLIEEDNTKINMLDGKNKISVQLIASGERYQLIAKSGRVSAKTYISIDESQVIGALESGGNKLLNTYLIFTYGYEEEGIESSVRRLVVKLVKNKKKNKSEIKFSWKSAGEFTPCE